MAAFLPRGSAVRDAVLTMRRVGHVCAKPHPSRVVLGLPLASRVSVSSGPAVCLSPHDIPVSDPALDIDILEYLFRNTK